MNVGDFYVYVGKGYVYAPGTIVQVTGVEDLTFTVQSSGTAYHDYSTVSKNTRVYKFLKTAGDRMTAEALADILQGYLGDYQTNRYPPFKRILGKFDSPIPEYKDFLLDEVTFVYQESTDGWKRQPNGSYKRDTDETFDTIHRIWGPKDHYYNAATNEWLHNSVKPKRPPWTTNHLGIQIQDFPLCCGAKIMKSFNMYSVIRADDTNETDVWYPAGIREAFKNTLDSYRGKGTGIILAILSPIQYHRWNEYLLEAGFKLTSKHTNYVHNHPNYLYQFTCDQNKIEVQEVKRAFGT